MGGFAAGLAGAIGDHLHEQHLLNLQQQVESKRNLLDNYKTLLSDPHMADVHGDIAGALLKAAGTDPTKLHKQIGKPGGEFDPTQWQALAQQRHAGAVPSPVNQGQNPTQIPAAPVQHDSTPGGGAQTAPAWNNASTQAMGPPPGGMSAGDGAGAGMGDGMSIPLPPGVQSPSSQGPAPAEIVGNMGAQAVQALPPTPGSPAPNGVEVSSPQQAAAVAPPPAPSAPIYQGNGSLTQEELNRRSLAFKSQTDEAQQQAEMRRYIAVEKAKQQITEDQRAKQVKNLKESGVWDKLGPREQGAITTGLATLGNTPRALPTLHGIAGTDAPPDQTDFAGKPIDPNGRYEVRTNPANGETEWHQIPVALRSEWSFNKDTGKNDLYLVNPYNGDRKLVEDTSKINPSLLATKRSVNSTTDASGHTVGETTTQKVVPGVGAGGGSGGQSIPPPPVTGRPAGGSSSGVGGGNPTIKRYAEDLRDGKNPVIPPKDRDAVTSYMVKNNIASPTPLSAKGAGDLQAIDPVISQVDDLLKRLRKMKDDGNPLSLVKDYQMYKHGFSTSNSDLFTNLSFEQLRSAAAALKGTNARAYPILQRAFEHTPTLERMGGLNPDSPKAIFGKLVEMKKLLQQGRNSILADEKKSGIPGGADNGIPAPPAGGGSTLDDLINKYK